MQRKPRTWVIAMIMLAGVGDQLKATCPSLGLLKTDQNRPLATALAAQLPEPLATAIMLLGWSGDGVPRIEVVDGKPADATTNVEAWVRRNADGSAVPIIYVRRDTEVYRDAARRDYQALVRLAGILAHERWHLRHPGDEVGAYTAQLSTMEYLHANTMHLAVVRRALRQVQQQEKK